MTNQPLLERLLDLWTNPEKDDTVARARFAACYTDPVTVNGEDVPIADLLIRARMLQSGLADVTRTVVDSLEGPHRLAFAFRLSGRHVGPLPTPLGPVPGDGSPLDILGIDILQLDEDGRICAISVLSGLMDALATSGALRLASQVTTTHH